MRGRILVSFSAGATSALMAYILKTCAAAHELVFVFSNTGAEDERTLEFARRCDEAWGLDLVWLEADVRSQKGESTGFRRVSFANASRCGEPFEAVVAKYGLPGPKYPHCNRELKLAPIHAYARTELGWDKGSYSTAIGIRADEIDRMSEGSKRLWGAVYPLIGLGVTKDDVRAFWDAQPFRLEVPEHRGNCVWCWKKSLKKLTTLAQEDPSAFDFPAFLEQRYAQVGAPLKPRRMFRGERTTGDILALSQEPFEKFIDPHFDLGNGCGETCEIHADAEAEGWDLL